MNLELVAKLERHLPVQSGKSARGDWSKQEFVVETQDTYPKKICMNVWGEDKIKELQNYNEGELLRISFNLESREFNGRWYTDIRAWKLERANNQTSSIPSDGFEPVIDHSMGMTAGIDMAEGDENDDLPF